MPPWLPPLLFAPFAGSFLGVLIRRLPRGRAVVVARSACEACGRVLRWHELVPLLGFVLAGGRCRTCGAPIAGFHWRIELAALLPAAWAVLAGDAGAALWADCVLGWGLLALAWIDWEHGRLPDALTLPLVVLGLGATWWLDPAATLDHAGGAAAGYLLFRGVAWAYRALRHIDGLGQGDAKLLAAAGAWVGWNGLGAVILGGALASIALAFWRARGRPTGTTSVPFGPGLALATMAVRLHFRY